MKTWMTRIGVMLMVAVMAFGVVGSAAAQGPDDDGEATDLRNRQVMGAMINAFTEVSGLSREVVMQALRDGQSLNDLAAANGVDVEAVKSTASANVTERVNTAVAEGRMTQERADQLLARLDSMMERALNASLPDALTDRQPVKNAGLRTLIGQLSEMTGLSVVEMAQSALDGQTMAEIATANGIEPGAVVAAALAQTTERANEAVANGRITQEQADNLIAEAQSFYNEAINQPLPQIDRDFDRMQDARLSRTLLGVMADQFGGELNLRDVVGDLDQPVSMASIANALGLDANAIISAAEAQITAEVSAAVADGRISQERADEALADLNARLTEQFNAPLRPEARPGARRGATTG